MSDILREDGTKTFYQVEIFFGEGFGNPEDRWGLAHEPRKDWEEKHSFSACGNCWQETGHHGTYDEQFGFMAMIEHAQRKSNKGHIFRLVKRTVTMKTEQVGQVCVQKENEAA